MLKNCPKGYYYKNGRCLKSITIKRKGIYGKGFLSEPQSEQYSKIRKEEKIEGHALVDRQMDALNSFQHDKGSAHKDLEYANGLRYAEKYVPSLFMEEKTSTNSKCPYGYRYVNAYMKHGKMIKGYCRRDY